MLIADLGLEIWSPSHERDVESDLERMPLKAL